DEEGSEQGDEDVPRLLRLPHRSAIEEEGEPDEELEGEDQDVPHRHGKQTARTERQRPPLAEQCDGRAECVELLVGEEEEEQREDILLDRSEEHTSELQSRSDL